jgi:hypothetical protein
MQLVGAELELTTFRSRSKESTTEPPCLRQNNTSHPGHASRYICKLNAKSEPIDGLLFLKYM